LPAGFIEPVGPKSSLELAGCAFCFTSIRGLGSTMSHQHGTSSAEPCALEDAVSDEHSLFWGTGHPSHVYKNKE
jgi:hypothetical protein